MPEPLGGIEPSLTSDAASSAFDSAADFVSKFTLPGAPRRAEPDSFEEWHDEHFSSALTSANAGVVPSHDTSGRSLPQAPARVEIASTAPSRHIPTSNFILVLVERVGINVR